jgi:hypothetical protein
MAQEMPLIQTGLALIRRAGPPREDDRDAAATGEGSVEYQG